MFKAGDIIKRKKGGQRCIVIDAYDDKIYIGYISKKTGKFETEMHSADNFEKTDDYYDIKTVDEKIRNLLTKE